MTEREKGFRVRPGRIGDRGGGRAKKLRSLAGDVKRAAMKAGFVPRRSGGGGPRFGRGRSRALTARTGGNARRVVIMARVVRQKSARFGGAPLARHIAYLEREGVTRDGGKPMMFDAAGRTTDCETFAARCEDDRHHFRFIVSPEDAREMSDLRAFTRELMGDMERDLGTKLDWVAIDHWNTDNPHVHILVRGVADDGRDLVMDRDYIRAGMRARAEERVTMELGHRSEQEVERALAREVDASRWTSLDRSLARMADANAGVVDLRPGEDRKSTYRQLLLGRAAKLEALGLADRLGPGCWSLKADAQSALRDISIRSDIIKTMHRAMHGAGRDTDVTTFALHDDSASDPVIGRLVERGLQDELSGSAYALVDGVDGRLHHLRFDDLDLTGDARPGAIVELRAWNDAHGNTRRALAVRSDLPVAQQIHARGATWLDRQLVARGGDSLGGGFGEEVRKAMSDRADQLVAEGLASRSARGVVLARNLIATLRGRELNEAVAAIAERTGLEHRPSQPGETASGVYRERIALAAGRFAMLDDGLGFQLVPWRPALDSHLGRTVGGVMNASGGIDWTLGRTRGLSP